jgi:hypothetical protein
LISIICCIGPVKLEIIDTKGQKKLSKYADAHPVKSANFFERSIELRELLYRMFLAVSKAEIRSLGPKAFNSMLSEHCTTLQIKYEGNNYTESWECEDDLRNLTLPINLRTNYYCQIN